MHILVLEDDPAIAHTLCFALHKENWQVQWVSTLADGFDALQKANTISAIILDVGLPDGTGFEFCQKVRFGTHFADVPIVFLSARHDELERVLGLELGADDYIAKPFSPKEVIARIKAICRRHARQHENTHHDTNANSVSMLDFNKTIQQNHWKYYAYQYRLCLNGVALALSKTELAIMLALLQNPTHVLSRTQLLHAISDHPEHRLLRTIDAHIKTLRQKLAAVTDDDIIITHRGLGYSLDCT